MPSVRRGGGARPRRRRLPDARRRRARPGSPIAIRSSRGNRFGIRTAHTVLVLRRDVSLVRTVAIRIVRVARQPGPWCRRSPSRSPVPWPRRPLGRPVRLPGPPDSRRPLDVAVTPEADAEQQRLPVGVAGRRVDRRIAPAERTGGDGGAGIAHRSSPSVFQLEPPAQPVEEPVAHTGRRQPPRPGRGEHHLPDRSIAVRSLERCSRPPVPYCGPCLMGVTSRAGTTDRGITVRTRPAPDESADFGRGTGAGYVPPVERRGRRGGRVAARKGHRSDRGRRRGHASGDLLDRRTHASASAVRDCLVYVNIDVKSIAATRCGVV